MDSFLSLKATIRTHNFEASCHFYEKILGLEKLEGWHEVNDRGCIYRAGLSPECGLLEISEIGKDHEYFQSEFHQPASLKIDLQLATSDLDSWVKRLRGNWQFRGPVDRPWGSRYLYVLDPDQVQIIIYEHKQH